MVSPVDGLKLLPLEYYNPEKPASYSGARNLIESFRKRVPRQKILGWLEKQEAYTKHRPVRRKYPRRTYNVHCVDDLWEGDLIDFKSLSRFNKGFSYLLVVIDALSKNLWIEPLRNKTSASVSVAFEKILRESNRQPTIYQSDKGREFTGKQMQDVLQKFDIAFRTSRSPDTKSSIAERVIRTIKERIWRFLTPEKRSHTYKSYRRLFTRTITQFTQGHISDLPKLTVATNQSPIEIYKIAMHQKKELEQINAVSETTFASVRPKLSLGKVINQASQMKFSK